MYKLTINGVTAGVSHWCKDSKVKQRIRKMLVDEQNGLCSLTHQEILDKALGDVDQETINRELQGLVPIKNLNKNLPRTVVESMLSGNIFQFCKACDIHGIGQPRDFNYKRQRRRSYGVV